MGEDCRGMAERGGCLCMLGLGGGVCDRWERSIKR